MMFSTRNSQTVPGIKSFGMQGPTKGVSGVRVFKGPTLSSFNPNPFSVMSARFDSFDVGYRPSQVDLSQRLNGSTGSQQQNWRTPANIYPPPQRPPPPPSHSYQQNPTAQFGIRSNNTASTAASRSQEPPRHSQSQSNYSIYPGTSTDMYIYEASDAYSEYSPSPSPSTFSPALSTDSTVTLEPQSPFPQRQSDSRDRDGRSTPSMRTNTPRPTQSQTNSYPSSSSMGTDRIPFPSGSPGSRQAQTRGMFENGQADTRPRSDPSGQAQDSSNFIRSRTRAPSNSADTNVLADSDAEFDHLARMNTALNAGYSHYYPESNVPRNSIYSTSANSTSASGRSPRDSLMFYNGVQLNQHSMDFDRGIPSPKTAPAISTQQSETETSAIIAGQAPEEPGNGNEVNVPHPRGGSASAPHLHSSVSNSSQSTEFSILEAPPLNRPFSSMYLQPSPNPDEQHNPTYTSVLSASPEPQFSSSPTVSTQVQAPNLVPTHSQSRYSSASSPSSTTLNGSDYSSFQVTGSLDRVVAASGSGGTILQHNNDALSLETTPSFTGQSYPMPHGVREARSSTSGEPRGGTATSRESNETPVGARRSPVVTHNPSSPPRIYSQPSTEPQRVNAPLPATAASAPLAPPAAVSVPQQQRIRKDSMSLGPSRTSSSSSHRISRSYPHTTPSYSNASNSEILVSSSAAAPSHIPSSFPEPRRRHSDGENPSLTDATRRSSVPFQSEFVPAVSTSASAQGANRSVAHGRDLPAVGQLHTEPTRARSTENSRPAAIQINPEMLQIRSVRWNEDLICPSPIFPSQRRKGWFNRRGDQLWTNGGAFRSPPEGREYPSDLNEYPEYGQGWMNEEGVRIDMAHRLIPKPPLRSALKVKRATAHTGC